MALPAYATSGEVALKPGFERIKALLTGMGHPERHREIILVAGTNGKGSTASMLAAMSSAAGVCTGLHTSPHLVSVTERMRVNGVAPSEAWLAGEVLRWETLFARVQPSFFEATLALSLRWFADQEAERCVVEIGLGGRYDAANALEADLCILTSVGRDHMQLLGPTLSDVAAEKAAIGKRGKPFIMAPLEEPSRTAAYRVLQSIGARVTEINALTGIRTTPDGTLTLTTSRRQVTHLKPPLPGPHQQVNPLLAIEAMDQLHDPLINAATLRDGLGSMQMLSGLRARGEWLLPGVMIDVAQNESALEATLRVFLNAASDKTPVLVLGFLADKDPGKLGDWLLGYAPVSTRIICVDTGGARGLKADEAALRWIQSGWTGPIETTSDPADVLKQEYREGAYVLFAGSHQVVSRILSARP